MCRSELRGQFRICNADDGHSDLNQPDGRDLTCREIEACFGTCNAGENDCFDRCHNSGSTSAREAEFGGACSSVRLQ